MHSRKVNIWTAVLISSVLLLTAGIGAVYAYLSVATEEHTDTIIAATTTNLVVTVTPQTGMATASVEVPNAGYKVFVRAVVVVNWIKDEEICAAPDGASYVVTASSGWAKNGDFYYYDSAIDSLEDVFEVTYNEVDGYEVQVQIILQTIQAVGTVDEGTATAVYDAWGVNMG